MFIRAADEHRMTQIKAWVTTSERSVSQSVLICVNLWLHLFRAFRNCHAPLTRIGPALCLNGELSRELLRGGGGGRGFPIQITFEIFVVGGDGTLRQLGNGPDGVGAAAGALWRAVAKQVVQIIPSGSVIRTGASLLRPMLFGYVDLMKMVRASHRDGFGNDGCGILLATTAGDEKQKASCREVGDAFHAQ